MRRNLRGGLDGVAEPELAPEVEPEEVESGRGLLRMWEFGFVGAKTRFLMRYGKDERGSSERCEWFCTGLHGSEFISSVW